MGNNDLQGVMTRKTLSISHLLFVDDVLLLVMVMKRI